MGSHFTLGRIGLCLLTVGAAGCSYTVNRGATADRSPVGLTDATSIPLADQVPISLNFSDSAHGMGLLDVQNADTSITLELRGGADCWGSALFTNASADTTTTTVQAGGAANQLDVRWGATGCGVSVQSYSETFSNGSQSATLTLSMASGGELDTGSKTPAEFSGTTNGLTGIGSSDGSIHEELSISQSFTGFDSITNGNINRNTDQSNTSANVITLTARGVDQIAVDPPNDENTYVFVQSDTVPAPAVVMVPHSGTASIGEFQNRLDFDLQCEFSGVAGQTACTQPVTSGNGSSYVQALSSMNIVVASFNQSYAGNLGSLTPSDLDAIFASVTTADGGSLSTGVQTTLPAGATKYIDSFEYEPSSNIAPNGSSTNYVINLRDVYSAPAAVTSAQSTDQAAVIVRYTDPSGGLVSYKVFSLRPESTF